MVNRHLAIHPGLVLQAASPKQRDRTEIFVGIPMSAVIAIKIRLQVGLQLAIKDYTPHWQPGACV